MENLFIIVAVLAAANTQITRLFISWLKNFFNLEFNATVNQITSWAVACLLALVCGWLGLIPATLGAVIGYGLLSGLASNGIWNIKNWFAGIV